MDRLSVRNCEQYHERVSFRRSSPLQQLQNWNRAAMPGDAPDQTIAVSFFLLPGPACQRVHQPIHRIIALRLSPPA